LRHKFLFLWLLKYRESGILQGLCIAYITPNGGSSCFFGAAQMPDGLYNYTTITRDQFNYLVGGPSVVYFTTGSTQIYGPLILSRSNPSGINQSPYLIRQQCDWVVNAFSNCNNNGLIYLGMEASEDCASGQGRALCYNSNALPAISAKFTLCTCSDATTACQQLFPTYSNVTSVYASTIGCLNQNLNPATRYLCVVPE